MKLKPEQEERKSFKNRVDQVKWRSEKQWRERDKERERKKMEKINKTTN